MKSFVMKGIVLFLVILNILLLYRNYSQRQIMLKATQKLNEYKEQLTLKQNIIDKLKDNFLEQTTKENINLNDSILHLIRKNKNSNRKLIFRFTEGNCNYCVNEQIDILRNYSKSSEKEKIIIMCGYDNKRNFEIFQKENKNYFEIINVKKGMLPFDKNNEPYYFIFDHTLKAQQFFIPLSTDTILTKEYLNRVFEKFK